MHPGLFDACVQPIFLLLPKDKKSAYIASYLSEFVLYQLPTQDMWYYLKIDLKKSKERYIYGSWQLFDETGGLIASCADSCSIHEKERPLHHRRENKITLVLRWGFPEI